MSICQRTQSNQLFRSSWSRAEPASALFRAIRRACGAPGWRSPEIVPGVAQMFVLRVRSPHAASGNNFLPRPRARTFLVA